MIRILLALVCLNCAVRAGEPAKTASRTLALIEKTEFDTPESREHLRKVAKWADAGLVPALRNATSIEVYSLDPDKYKYQDLSAELGPPGDGRPQVPKRLPVPKGTVFFYDYRVLGKVTVERGARFEKLRESLITGIAPGSMMLCYSPRHGIRVKGKTGTIDLVICFQCGRSAVYGLKSDAPPWSFIPPVTKDLLNEILDEAKIERDLTERKQ
ncbi:MAG TPA: hypothetical protein VGO11_18440 [Chthoniobacteraceae bacterium]|jgi:hypothetical protein|nr:hypothetical protein [Chthoniobacteraceae bacterium]